VILSITESLAGLLAGADYNDLPSAAVEAATQVVLDGIGVTVAATRASGRLSQIILDYVRPQHGSGDASVIAGGFSTSPESAAFANGALCHALDFESIWHPAEHPTSPTLPAILAIAEARRCTGRDVIKALVLAFEVSGRMRVASARMKVGAIPGYHPPGVSGMIGATAGAGVILNLKALELQHAFGIAASRCGSLAANAGTMTKSTHSGHGARMGVESATLAGMGFTACADIFDSGGFFETFYGAEVFDRDLFLRDFGRPYRLVSPGVGMKKYPSNRFTHRPIDAALALREAYALAASDIVRVEIDMPPLTYVDRPKPTSGLDGKFSVQFATAVALMDGDVTVDSFSDARVNAAEVVDLLRRTELKRCSEIPVDTVTTWAVVRLFLRDGRVVERRCDTPRGDPAMPLTKDERLDKFRTCMMPTFSSARTEAIIDMVGDLVELNEVSRLMALIRDPA
jgi:2-methylcitrate dehydratase PrpD